MSSRSSRFLALLVLAPALVVTLSAAATVFRDIPPGHWARQPAGVLHDRKIMTGRTPVDFAGEVPLTRYELARILSGLYNVEGPPGTFLVLKDQPPSHPSTLEVQRVIGYGLMKPKTPATFDGEALVTRQELCEAVDNLFSKNGVSAPTRRQNPVFFTDVPPGSTLGLVLDRIFNRYSILEGKGFTAFNAKNSVARFYVLAMLVKAMPYLNPPVALELRATPKPTPVPSGGTPTSAEPTPEESLEPGQSPAPRPSPTPIALLRNRAQLGGDVVLLYNEGLPQTTGAIAAAESKGFSGNMLPGGALSGEVWSGPIGGGLAVTSNYVGINAPHLGKQVPVDLLESIALASGYYKLGAGPGWELAVGAAGMFRNTYNLTGEPNGLLSLYYITADKTYLSAGPAAAWGLALAPHVALTGDLQVFPAIMETYTLSSNGAFRPKSVMRWGSNGVVRVEYGLGGGLYLSTGVRFLLSGAYDGGIQTMIGAQAGLGTTF